jgi:predicted nucleotidyltransferase
MAEAQLEDLPTDVRRVLIDFVAASRDACGPDLIAVVLFGSAAEGRLRATSDVNVIVVLQSFELKAIERLRESLRFAHTAIDLEVMFLLESEIALAAEVFATKFQDIEHRHRVLFGRDPFANLHIPRAAIVQRLEQVFLNLLLRLRSRYAMTGASEMELATLLADVAGPLRAAAATIASLEGTQGLHPKEALAALVTRLPDKDWQPLLSHLSAARETQHITPAAAATTVRDLLDLLQAMQRHLQALH